MGACDIRGQKGYRRQKRKGQEVGELGKFATGYYFASQKGWEPGMQGKVQGGERFGCPIPLH